MVNFPSPNSWTHLASSKRHKITESIFDGDIWTLSNINDVNNLMWHKLSNIPINNIDTFNELNVLFYKKLKQVLVFVKNVGVYSLQL